MATKPAKFAVGSHVWLPDDKDAWLYGEVLAINGADLLVSVASAGAKSEQVTVPAISCFAKEDDGGVVDDMVRLAYLHEPGVLNNLMIRYQKNIIYTYTGTILIAANPFMRLPGLYDAEMREAYRGAALGDLSPHVFAIADNAYRAMREESTSQAILISGESGAGKTETTKLVMEYLASAGGRAKAGEGDDRNIERQVLESNPLLEAFGNAKTVRNDNSSRFGKFIEIQFDARGRVSGAAIRSYLLERSRVVQIADPERNYHCFYQLLDGVTPEEAALFLLPEGPNRAEKFHYLNQSQCFELRGKVDNAEEFKSTRRAMGVMGITQEEQTSIFKILSAVLHLGNVEFKEKGDKLRVTKPSDDHLDAVATLLSCDRKKLVKSLTTIKRKVGGETIESSLDIKGAVVRRDTLAKTLYSHLFDWIVDKINRAIGQDPNRVAIIGVLDIYGFEHFKINSFEQFCINLANEKLQQHFNQHVLKLEQEEYEREAINWSYINFKDNQDVLDLVEGEKGILSELDSACKLSQSTAEGFTQSLYAAFLKHERFSKSKGSVTDFTLAHYAGQVKYSTTEFISKNMDAVVAEHELLLQKSGDPFISSLFPPAPPSDDKKPGSKFTSLGRSFKHQLALLMEILNSTQPHYIRCIKPHPASRPGMFSKPSVTDQLRSGGVLEAIRMCSQGYPSRKAFFEFIDRFALLVPGLLDAERTEKEYIDLIMKHAKLDNYQIGKSKVFLRAGQMAHLDASRRESMNAAARKIQRVVRWYFFMLRRKRAAVTIQRYWRGYRARKQYQQLRREHAALKLQRMERMRQQRMRFLLLREATVVIQSYFRMHHARTHFLEMRDNHAATTIQRHWRGFISRKPLAVFKRFFLGKLARLRLTNIKLEATRQAELAPPRKKSEVAIDTIRMMMLRVMREKADKARLAAERQLVEVKAELEQRDRELASRARELAVLTAALEEERRRVTAAEAELAGAMRQKEEQWEEMQARLKAAEQEGAHLARQRAAGQAAAGLAGAAALGSEDSGGPMVSALSDSGRAWQKSPGRSAPLSEAGVLRGSSFSVRQSPSSLSDAKHARRHSVAEAPRGLRRQSSLIQYPSHQRERERERERAALQGVEPSPRAVLARTYSQGQRRKSVSGMTFSDADTVSQAEGRGGGAGQGEQQATQSLELKAAGTPVGGVSEGGVREKEEGGADRRGGGMVSTKAEGKESVEKVGSPRESEPQVDEKEKQVEEWEVEKGETVDKEASEDHKMAHSLSDVKEEEEEEVEWGRQEVKRKPSLKTIRERDDMGSGKEQAGRQGGEEERVEDIAAAAAAAAAAVTGESATPSSSSVEAVGSGEGWREASAVRLKQGSVSMSMRKPPALTVATADGSPDRNFSPSVQNKKMLSFGSRSSRGAASSSMPSPHAATTAAAAAVSGLTRETGREAGRERTRMGAVSSSSGVSNAAGGAAASGGGSGALPHNFERIIAGMQKDLEYAQKLKEENKILKAAYHEAVARMEEAEAAVEAERDRAEEALRVVAVRDADMEAALAKVQEVHEKLVSKSREVRTLSQRLLASQNANAPNVVPIDKQQELLLHHIAQQLLPFGPSGQPTAACLLYKALLHWKTFQAEKTNAFDRVIETFQGASRTDDMYSLGYWLANHVGLFYLVQVVYKPAPEKKKPEVIGFGFFAARPPTPAKKEASHQVDLMLFKLQLTTGIERLYITIRDVVKAQLGALFTAAGQAHSHPARQEEGASGEGASATGGYRAYRERMKKNATTGTARQSATISYWTKIVVLLRHATSTLLEARVPAVIILALLKQLLFFVNVKIINGLMVRSQWCPCTYSNAEVMEEGLFKLDGWTSEMEDSLLDPLGVMREGGGGGGGGGEVEYQEESETLAYELRHVRQATYLLTMEHKPRRSLAEIREMCPDLSMNQLVHLSIWFEDDKYGSKGVDSAVIEQMWGEVTDDSPMLLKDPESIPFNLDDIVIHLPAMPLEEVDLPPELQDNASLHFLLLDNPPISASPFFSSSPAMSPSSLRYQHTPLYTPQSVASARGQRSHQFDLQAEAYQRASTVQGRSDRGSSGTSWDIFSTRSSTAMRDEF